MSEKTLGAGWRGVKFGEIAENVNERIDDPRTAGVDRYVGLEHLDPDDLRIRRWGSPADVEAMKLRFRAGDIIFGRRRAYQRKLALADFEGICSAHAMVLRERRAAVAPGFLPFFMQSDIFMSRAQSISVGSLSPTISWKALAVEEFVLPPIEQQRHFVTAFVAGQRAIDAASICCDAAKNALRALLKVEYGCILETAPLSALCLPIVRGIDSPGPDTPSGVPYVRVSEMTGEDGIIVANLLRTTQELSDAHPESRLCEGDMVVALRGVVGLAVSVPAAADGANLSRGTARVSVLQEHNREFVFWALRSPRVQQTVLQNATGWKGEDLREITLAALRNLRVPFAPRAQQDCVAKRVVAMAQAVNSTSRRLAFTRAVMAALVARAVQGA